MARKGCVIAVHGGAGRHRPAPGRMEWIAESLRAGTRVLASGGSALDAVQRAIEVMELSGKFNAGLGAVRQEDGVRRMDAALMEGARLRAGAVTGARAFPTPVALARWVLEKTPHVIMRGEFAARLMGKRELARLKRVRVMRTPVGSGTACDTVGAIAFDRRGDCAAGTSTGGAPPMLPGRIGDSPLPGAGLYADNASGAVSCTGKGESIIRVGLAAGICERMGKGRHPATASRSMLRRLFRRVGGIAGVIVLDCQGRVSLMHNGWMSAGVMRPGEAPRLYCRRRTVSASGR